MSTGEGAGYRRRVEILALIIGPTAGLVGVVLGSRVTRAGEAGRWRRDWTAERIRRREDFYGDLIRTMDDLHILLRLVVDAGLGKARHPEQERIDSVTETWRSHLARSRMRADNSVVEKLYGYDAIRGRVADAMNAGKGTAAIAAVAELDAARQAVLDAIAADAYAMNEALAPHVLTWWQRRRGQGPPPPRLGGADNQPSL